MSPHFHGRALSTWILSTKSLILIVLNWSRVSLWMNTTAPRDKFKPIQIGDNFVVNYDGGSEQ